MILVFCSTKGGVGKSNLAYHAATAVLQDFRLLEIDDNNKTSLIFNDSVVLEDKVVSVDIKSGEDAFGDALFAMSQDDGVDVIIDAGGGNDSKRVIEMVISQTSYDETVFIIPLMSGREQVQNALATYELVKLRKVLFVLNAGREKSEFIFWFGDEIDDIPSVSKELLNVPTIFIPWTQLFDKAAMSGEIIKDIWSFYSLFKDGREARAEIGKLAKGDKAEFKRLLNRYRLASSIDGYITNELANFKFALESLRE